MTNNIKDMLQKLGNLNEGKQVRTQGNQVVVTDEQGNTTTYDKETWQNMHKDGMNESEFDSVDHELEDDEQLLTEVEPIVMDQDDYPNSVDSDEFVLDTTYDDYVDDEMDVDGYGDEPVMSDYETEYQSDIPSQYEYDDEEYVDYAPVEFDDYDNYEDDEGVDLNDLPMFDPTDPQHVARLQRGTIIEIGDSLENYAGQRGVVIGQSTSGFQYQVMLGDDQVIVHINDIIAADIESNSMFESLESEFDGIMESIVATKTVDENGEVKLELVATESDVDEISDLITNAGIEIGEDGDDEDELIDEAANTPEPVYADLDAILKSGNDMHRPKKTYKPVAGGDNPMSSNNNMADLLRLMDDK